MSDLEKLKEQIKRTVTMDDVLDALDMGPIPRGRKIRSIYNQNEKTPSLHLYVDHFVDFSTGKGGDQIKFVMDSQGVSFTQAVRFLSGMVDEFDVKRVKAPERKVVDMTAQYREEPEGKEHHIMVWEDLVARKWPYLDPTVVYDYGKVVKREEFWIPHYHEDKIVGIKVRNIHTGKKLAVQGSTFTQALYTPRLTCYERAVIVEGESDAWHLLEWLDQNWRALDVYALPAGAGSWNDNFREQLRGYPNVQVMLDGDKAGVEAMNRIRLDTGYTTFYRPGFRLAEWITQGWNPMEALDFS